MIIVTETIHYQFRSTQTRGSGFLHFIDEYYTASSVSVTEVDYHDSGKMGFKFLLSRVIEIDFQKRIKND